MIDKPLDCVGTTDGKGKSDYRESDSMKLWIIKKIFYSLNDWEKFECLRALEKPVLPEPTYPPSTTAGLNFRFFKDETQPRVDTVDLYGYTITENR